MKTWAQQLTADWLNFPDDVMMQLINQVPVLLGVIIGVLGSYLTTAATERARWKRTLDSRWDDRRVEAYALYAQSVKRMIKVAGRIAAGRDLGGDDEPLAPTQENLELLADAEAERGRQWETVLLLGHPQTVGLAEAGMNVRGGLRHTRVHSSQGVTPTGRQRSPQLMSLVMRSTNQPESI